MKKEICLTRICAVMDVSSITAFSRPLLIFGTEAIEVAPESSPMGSLGGGREKTSPAVWDLAAYYWDQENLSRERESFVFVPKRGCGGLSNRLDAASKTIPCRPYSHEFPVNTDAYHPDDKGIYRTALQTFFTRPSR